MFWLTESEESHKNMTMFQIIPWVSECGYSQSAITHRDLEFTSDIVNS